MALAAHRIQAAAGHLVGVVDARETIDLELRRVVAEIRHADHDLPPVFLGLLPGDLVVARAGVQPARVERREEPALGRDIGGEGSGPVGHFRGQCLDEIGAAERVGDLADVGLVLEDLLDTDRHLVGVFARHRDGLVVARYAERLGAAEHGRQRHHRPAHDVIERLRVGHHRAGRDDMDAQLERPLVGDAIALAQEVMPELARGAQLGDVLEEIHGRAEVDAADLVRGRRHVEMTAALDLVEVLDGVGDHRAELLPRVQAAVATVVAGDRYRYPLRCVLRAELDDVGVEAQTRRGRNLLLGDATEVGQEEVALAGAAQLFEGNAAASGDRPVGGERERRMLDDGAAGMAVGALDRDAVEADRDLADALHHRTRLADVLATGHHVRMVDVVEMVRGVAIVFHQEPGFAVMEQEFDPLVLVFGLAEAGQLENPPRLRAVALRERAAVIRGLTGQRAGHAADRLRHVIGPVGSLERDS